MATRSKSPDVVVIGGVIYQKTLLMIHTRDPVSKCPALVKLLQDKDDVDLEGSEEFMFAYVPRPVLKGKESTIFTITEN